RGWTDWQGLIDMSTYRMWGYSFFENDHRVTYGKVCSRAPRLYQTDVVTNKAVRFIDERASRDRPFFLSVAYLAPHHESGATQRGTGPLTLAAPTYHGRLVQTQQR